MTTQTLEQVRRGTTSGGVGLTNVSERLKNVYGSEYVPTTSVYGEGTTVRFAVPLGWKVMSSYRPAKLRVLWWTTKPGPVRTEVFAGKDGKVTVIGDAASGPEAIELTYDLRPEAVFLDIKMPGQDGFAVAEAILAANRQPPLFVFATAFDSYALQAFEVSAVDYILKPFQQERVAQTVERLLSQVWL